MNVDLNFPIKNLDDEPMQDAAGEPVMAGKVLASVLISQTTGDVIKFYDWALELHKGRTITLDNADQQTLKRFITESASMTILLKRNLLHALDSGHNGTINHNG